MGRPCTVCGHAERDAIDRALVEQHPNRRVAARYGLTEQAVRRHRDDHLPATLARAHNAEEIAWADALLDQLRDLQRRTLGIMTVAEAAGDARTMLVAVHVARDNLGLLFKMWAAPSRPAWWTGEPRWTAPPDPATKAQALSEELSQLPDDVKDGIRAWLAERRLQWLTQQRTVAEDKMRSMLPLGE